MKRGQVTRIHEIDTKPTRRTFYGIVRTNNAAVNPPEVLIGSNTGLNDCFFTTVVQINGFLRE